VIVGCRARRRVGTGDRAGIGLALLIAVVFAATLNTGIEFVPYRRLRSTWTGAMITAVGSFILRTSVSWGGGRVPDDRS
jgi:hypothetical protein